MVLIVLAMGLFLLGAAAFAVDMANLWFHRQSAQNAADAACMAGAMDILAKASGASVQGFIGSPFDCKTNSSYVPCQYAAFNGYDGKNTTPGNQVYVSFPGAASVTGVPARRYPAKHEPGQQRRNQDDPDEPQRDGIARRVGVHDPIIPTLSRRAAAYTSER